MSSQAALAKLAQARAEYFATRAEYATYAGDDELAEHYTRLAEQVANAQANTL